jgi:hypothetical protein
VVNLSDAPATARPTGDYTDPFAKALDAAAAAKAAEQTVNLPSGAGEDKTEASASTVQVSGGDTSPTTTTTDTTPDTAPVDDEPVVTTDTGADTGVFAGYRTTIHWGMAGSADKVDDVTRLAPLHAGSTPLLVFLGTRDEGKRALFALVRSASTVGDGRCLPSGQDCQVIELRKGEAQFFDVTDEDGSVTQFELDVDKIDERYAESKATAKSFRRRASKTGRSVIEELAEAGQDYAKVFDYVVKDGALVRDVPATVAWAQGR